VELLVVISITALLIALLLPALSKARRFARIALCQGIMRQQGICVGMYITDCADYMPAVATPHFWDRWANNDGNGMQGLSRDTSIANAWGGTGISYMERVSCLRCDGHHHAQRLWLVLLAGLHRSDPEPIDRRHRCWQRPASASSDADDGMP
jgi:hypothetical protein